MKSVLLAALAIGVPFTVMLLLDWLGSSPGPMPAARTSAPSRQHAPAAISRPLAVETPAATPHHALPPGSIMELVPIGDSRPGSLSAARTPAHRPATPPTTTPPAATPARNNDSASTPPASPPSAIPATATPTTPAAGPALPAASASGGTGPSGTTSLADRIEDWLEDWRQRTKETPNSPREAAALYLARGDFERAATAFDRLLVQNPNDPDLLMGEALALTRLGRYDDALPLLTSILERDPKHVAARYHYGVVLTRLDRREEAIAAFKQLLEVAPNHCGALFNLAVLQQSLGQMQDAWTTWRRLTQRLSEGQSPPTSRPADGPSGSASSMGATLDAASTSEAWFHRGEVEMAMYQVKDAEQCFLEVTRLTPDDARAWCNLGIARAALARYDQAIPALNQALRFDPSLVPAMNQLAYTYATKYRDDGRAEDRQAVLDFCARSLAEQSQQPNIRAMRNALLDLDREPPPGAEKPTAPDDE